MLGPFVPRVNQMVTSLRVAMPPSALFVSDMTAKCISRARPGARP